MDWGTGSGDFSTVSPIVTGKIYGKLEHETKIYYFSNHDLKKTRK